MNYIYNYLRQYNQNVFKYLNEKPLLKNNILKVNLLLFHINKTLVWDL